MMVRDGKLVTPPVTAGILESITRTTLMDLAARELGAEVVEREVDRTELYVADEVFMCGSGLEVLPITSVDRIAIGDGTRGSMTKRIQDVYFSAARGRAARLPPLAHARVRRGRESRPRPGSARPGLSRRLESRPRRAQGTRGSCATMRRTSTLPKRAPGIRPATWTASSRSRASMR